MSYTDSDERKTKFCVNCGAKIDAIAEICPKCGVRAAPPRPEYVERKNPVLAAILSFILPGIGQIYNGQINEGIVFIIAAITCNFLRYLLIGYPLYIAVWIFGIIDAYNVAKKINKRQKAT